MKFSVLALAALAALSGSLSACASSQSYGRLQPLSQVETAALTCADVAADLHRVEGFLFEVNAAQPVRLIPTRTGRDNIRERDAARASAEVRRAQLLIAESQLGCDVLRGRIDAAS